MEGTGSDDGRLGGWGRDFPCDICPVDQGALRSACLDLSPRLGGFFDLLQREADALATRQEEGNLLHDETGLKLAYFIIGDEYGGSRRDGKVIRERRWRRRWGKRRGKEKEKR